MYGDQLFAAAKGGAAVGGHIAAGVSGVEPLDKQILDIAAGRRKAPGDTIIMPDEDERHAGNGAARDFALRRFHPRQIPKAGCGEAKMRVIGKDRLAAVAMRPVDHPVV